MLFFDVVMKVLMFIELVSGVKYPKMSTVGLLFEAIICGCFVIEPFFFCSLFCIFIFLWYCFFCLEFFCLYLGKQVVSTFFTFIFRVEKSVW